MKTLVLFLFSALISSQSFAKTSYKCDDTKVRRAGTSNYKKLALVSNYDVYYFIDILPGNKAKFKRSVHIIDKFQTYDSYDCTSKRVAQDHYDLVCPGRKVKSSRIMCSVDGAVTACVAQVFENNAYVNKVEFQANCHLIK